MPLEILDNKAKRLFGRIPVVEGHILGPHPPGMELLEEPSGQLILGAIGFHRPFLMPEGPGHGKDDPAVGPQDHHHPMAKDVLLESVVPVPVGRLDLLGVLLGNQDIVQDEPPGSTKVGRQQGEGLHQHYCAPGKDQQHDPQPIMADYLEIAADARAVLPGSVPDDQSSQVDGHLEEELGGNRREHAGLDQGQQDHPDDSNNSQGSDLDSQLQIRSGIGRAQGAATFPQRVLLYL